MDTLVQDGGTLTDRSRHALAGRWAVPLACAAFALLWLAPLAGRSLVSADEGRYASISLAMLQSGDWTTPRLNGLLYFEKPPLQYWAGALSMGLFGVNEFAARLWPGLAGLATVVMLAATARRLWGARAGLHAGLVAAATTWIVLNSHFLSLDAGLGAALTLVLCALLLADAAVDTRERLDWLRLAWLGVALAVLSKGLVGIVIPAAALVATALWERDASRLRRLGWTSGLPILLVVAGPWFVLASLRHPDFAWFFFVHEHVQRYLTPVHRREGAWWYFVPWLAVGLMPWTGALPALLRPPATDRAQRLLLVWAAFVFVFFSASNSKLPSYILPMFPALVLLVTRRIDGADERTLARHLVLPAVLWALALAATPFADRWAGRETPPAAVQALALGVAIGGALFLAGAAIAWRWLRQGRRSAALAAVALAHAVATLVVMASHDCYGQLKSADPIARALPSLTDPATPVFALRAYDQTLPFYLRRPVVLVDVRDEFEFGEAVEPERWIPTLDAFADRWRREPRAAAYLTRTTLAELQARGLPMRVVFEDPRRLVVVKP